MNLLKNFILSYLWRKKINKAWLQCEEFSPTLRDDLASPKMARHEIAVWDNISLRIDQMDSLEPIIPPVRQLQWHQKTSNIWPKAWAFCAILATLLLYLKTENGPLDLSRTKDAGPVTNPVSSLTFAIIKDDQRLERGYTTPKLHRGDALLFYVETPGSFDHMNFTIDVLVKTPHGKIETIVERYPIKSSTETLKGKNGYIIYKPEIFGRHTFFGRKRDQLSETDVTGFSIDFIE